MRNWGISFCVTFLACLAIFKVSGQEWNYERINVQGQLINPAYTESDFEFLVVGISGDTLWRESHSGIDINGQGAFTLPFGSGELISGTVDAFSQVNWLQASRVELYHIGAERYLQGAFAIQAVPYAFHSLHVLQGPKVEGLTDVSIETLEEGHVLKFEDDNFVASAEAFGDTLLFAWHADSVSYADTVWLALNSEFADTALFTYYTDSALYINTTDTTVYADTVSYVDSVSYAMKALNNWSVNGDEGRTDTNFVGTVIAEPLDLRTNNTIRFSLEDDFSTHNNFPGPGFRFRTQRAALFTPNINSGVSEIPGTYLYMDGETYSFHGGLSDGEIDTLKGTYSFVWGENAGTNGTYSTVFGKDSYGDTAYFGGSLTPYAAISSFAAGRNCHVTHMGVAIGDSAIAGYYRNIAIGKNVTSTTASAGVALGNNVLVTGATSWAAGRNVSATGHFSTAIGKNASTDGRNGSFVFGDNSTSDTVKNTAINQFMARAAGGFIFYSSADLTMGVELLAGAGSWSMISDSNKKRNIQKLRPEEYRQSFMSLPVSSWNYIGHNTMHIGPMAQDFYELFQVGEKPYYINMIDSDGVTLLGIKMLYDRVKEQPKNEDVKQLESEIENEKKKLDTIGQRINKLYEELDHN